ncbi:MAG: ATP-binding protein [Desulfuromonadaceae bacterium]
MEKPLLEKRDYLDASIRAAQYLAGLTTQQDLWTEIGKVLINFFGAGFCAIGEKPEKGKISIHHWTLSDQFAVRPERETDIGEAITEVLESGFLAVRIFTDPDVSAVFLPITHDKRTIAVLVIGHGVSEPPTKELLNVYLAVAGLVGTTFQRLASEQELRRHRQNLERLVRERTLELINVNKHLQQEIEQRRLAEGALRKEKDKLTAIFEAMEDEIYIADNSHNIVYVNSALKRHLGPFQQGKCYQYLNERTEPCPWCQMQEVQKGRTIRREQYFPRAKMTYDVIETPLERSGEILKLTIFRNISERKEMEEELKQAMAAAEAANQAKSAFLAHMSHELRTPLNAILGFSQLMARDESMSESARKNLAIVNRSGEHLLAMINDVLDLSKIEAGRVELQEEAFDLIRTLEEVGTMVHYRALSKGLDMRLELSPSLEQYVRTDLGKLRQVLINLMGNAVKFTEAGEVVLRVRTLPCWDEPSRRLLEIEVEDTGPGIKEEEKEVIFEPFRQVGSLKASQKGTGLGLAISRTFVRLMGGEIEVEGRAGKGTLFRVRIPVRLAASETVQNADALTFTIVGLESVAEEWRVLIVEDDPENAQLLETLLTGIGYVVRIATNGKEGVAVAQAWRPHFVWMDMKMPVMDGYQATRRIRSFPWGKNMGIYALTASVFSDQEDKILAAGCDGVFYKPFREREICEVMARHLGIRYRYAEKAAGEVAGVPAGALVVRPSPEDLASLPDEMARRIQLAAMELNKQEIIAVASELAEEYSVLAAFMTDQAASYNFEAIATLMESLIGERI